MLSDERINELVAVHVCGWHMDDSRLRWMDSDNLPTGCHVEEGDDHYWNPATSDADARVMREAIRDRKKETGYMWSLIEITADIHTAQLWRCLHATPRQQCEAALRAVGHWPKDGGE